MINRREALVAIAATGAAAPALAGPVFSTTEMRK